MKRSVIVPQPVFTVLNVEEKKKITRVFPCTIYKDCWICDPYISTKSLSCVKFENCVIDFLDTGEMCPSPSEFPVHEDGRLIGIRTNNSLFILLDWEYKVGEIYEAEIFSTSKVESCHPGLHVHPWKEWRRGCIKVLFDLEDLHSVHGAHRVRKFEVIA